MDTEDIKRHKHNFKVFCYFLRQNRIYLTMKKHIFLNRHLYPNNFFDILESNAPHSFNGLFYSQLTNDIDKRWAIIFDFVPYFGGYWDDPSISEIRYCMNDVTRKWKEFLLEHNYDKVNKT